MINQVQSLHTSKPSNRHRIRITQSMTRKLTARNDVLFLFSNFRLFFGSLWSSSWTGVSGSCPCLGGHKLRPTSMLPSFNQNWNPHLSNGKSISSLPLFPFPHWDEWPPVAVAGKHQEDFSFRPGWSKLVHRRACQLSRQHNTIHWPPRRLNTLLFIWT